MIEMKRLYKLDSKGKARVWFIEVDGSMYRAVSGLVDGKLVYNDWKLAKPKNVGRANATTGEEQAKREAEALYEKQLDQGGYVENLEDAVESTYFEPMLAYRYAELKEGSIDFRKPVFSQPKLDGIRCVATASGLRSRRGQPIESVPHIFEALSELFARFPTVTWDGELYNHELHDDFNTIQSLVSKKKPTEEDLAETRKTMQYHIYNFKDSANPGMKFVDRQEVLNQLRAEAWAQSGPVRIVMTDAVSSYEQLDSIYGTYLENNYEGQMLLFDGPYENKRTWSLVKRKEFIDGEFEIVSIEEGVGNWAGKAKRVWFLLPDGRKFKAGVRGTMEEMTQLLEKRDRYVGTEATVRFPNYTPDGIPRFGVVTHFHAGKRQF